jgi:hypothetical protein
VKFQVAIVFACSSMVRKSGVSFKCYSGGPDAKGAIESMEEKVPFFRFMEFISKKEFLF